MPSATLPCPKCSSQNVLFSKKRGVNSCKDCGNHFSAGKASLPFRVFLSYARGDDEAFVKRLHRDLSAAGFTVWFDRKSLLSRGLAFHQEIKNAISTEVDRVVY